MVLDNGFFEKYTSNTLAGTSNQSFFYSDGALKRGRVYYRIFHGGKFGYSLMFSGLIDSTYSDGSHSVCNIRCKEWRIHSLKVGRAFECAVGKASEPDEFVSLTFNGEHCTVIDGDMVCCDEFEFEADAGEYMCVEIGYSGEMIPYHEEIIVDSYDFADGVWVSSQRTPVPNLVGCTRNVKQRIAYLGDSITQGIGTPKNAYSHWNALLSEKLGHESSYWNLGIGFARSGDAASDGSWLYKVKQNDVVFVCLGVNDILKGKTAAEVCGNLDKIVCALKDNGVKVVLQSVPPFDYTGENKETWIIINDYIDKVLSEKADLYFDCVPVLGLGGEKTECAKYGGHPNEEGGRAWAEALYEKVKDFIGGTDR